MKATQHGFTLIELLIAISVFSLLVTMLFGALHLTARQAERRSVDIDRSEKVALIQEFLRSQLSDARPLRLAALGPPVVDFDGASERLSFISPATESVGFGGLQRLDIALENDPSSGGGMLSALWRPYRTVSDSVNATVRRSVLLGNVRLVGFAYYGADPTGTAQEWHESWREKSWLPMLVRMSVMFSDGTRMPELTIAVHSGASGPEERF